MLILHKHNANTCEHSLEQLAIHMQEKNFDSQLTSQTSINSNDYRLNYKSQHYKLVKECTGENVYELRISCDFLLKMKSHYNDKTWNGSFCKSPCLSKISYLEYIKIQPLCKKNQAKAAIYQQLLWPLSRCQYGNIHENHSAMSVHIY